MKSFVCCVVLMVVMARANPVPFYQEPANLDTPDDGDVGGGAGGANPNPQGGSPVGSSFLIPAGDSSSSSSSSSSSEEDYGSVDVPDGGGSVPAGTAQPASGPAGAGNRAGAAKGTGGEQGGKTGGNRGISNQNSGEQKLVAGDPALLSQIQGVPKSNNHKSSAGKSVGIVLGVLVLVSAATVAIIFAIRKRRDGFMRFYSQANAEL